MPYPGLKSLIKQTLTFLEVSYEVVINDSLSLEATPIIEMNFQK